MKYKYCRIQGRENSPQTGKPRGIFAMGWRMVYDGVLNEEEIELFKQIESWFKDHLPEPPFYENNNPLKIITYFKTEGTEEMFARLEPVCELLNKYHKAYDLVYTNFIPETVYEDDYQVAVVDCNPDQNK